MPKLEQQHKDRITKQIENCQRQIDHLNAIVNDPNATTEQVDAATNSLKDMMNKMDRLTGPTA